ncbi:MAG: type II toxin-antitoxin system RelE/ParE family toxin [Rhodomicrobiaceae bacterium]
MIYELSRQAKADIKTIIGYTDRYFGEAQTAEYIDGLFYSFGLLTDNPRMGREWDGDKRRYVYRMHHVYYRILEDRIFITHIRHASQGPQ